MAATLGAAHARADVVGEGHEVVFAVHGFSIGGSAYDANAPRPCIAAPFTGPVGQAACNPLQQWTYIGFGHGGFQLQDSRIAHQCLAATRAAVGAGLTLAPCDSNSDLQRWFLSGPADSAALRLWFHFGQCITAAGDGTDHLGTCGQPEVTSEMQQLTVIWTRAHLVLGVGDRASSGTKSDWTATIDGHDILGETVHASLNYHGNGNLQAGVLPGDYVLSVVTDGPDRTYSGTWAESSAASPDKAPFQTLETYSAGWGPYALGVRSPGFVKVRVPNDPALAFDTVGSYAHEVDNAPVR